jgi:hypothetical protein
MSECSVRQFGYGETLWATVKLEVNTRYNNDTKKAMDCTYYITEPQEIEKQIEKWKKDKSD